MRKTGLILFLLFPSIIASPQFKIQDFEKLNIEKVMSGIDTIKQEIDSTIITLMGHTKF
jgi:hypothetical protein